MVLHFSTKSSKAFFQRAVTQLNGNKIKKIFFSNTHVISFKINDIT